MVPLRLSPGETFAEDFHIEAFLAQGGTGAIYRARDRTSGQVVALKVLLPELNTDADTRGRFARESQAVAQIDSPYVPKIFRVGVERERGTPWFSMELLRGTDLRQAVESAGAMPVAAASWVLRELCAGMGAAHRVNMVHRDVKPKNVFLEEKPGEPHPRVRLLDFGSAKVLEAHLVKAKGTAAIGTPFWMAPEQTAVGGDISPATDVWALGLLAFWVLTGMYYWKAARNPTASIAELLRELHVDPIEPASARAKVIAPNVRLPDGFDPWFAQAVNRDSSRRFPNAFAAWEGITQLCGELANATEQAMAYAPTMEMSAMSIPKSKAPRATLAGGFMVDPEQLVDVHALASMTGADIPASPPSSAKSTVFGGFAAVNPSNSTPPSPSPGAIGSHTLPGAASGLPPASSTLSSGAFSAPHRSGRQALAAATNVGSTPAPSSGAVPLGASRAATPSGEVALPPTPANPMDVLAPPASAGNPPSFQDASAVSEVTRIPPAPAHPPAAFNQPPAHMPQHPPYGVQSGAGQPPMMQAAPQPEKSNLALWILLLLLAGTLVALVTGLVVFLMVRVA